MLPGLIGAIITVLLIQRGLSVDTVLLPNYILVGHAATVVHAAKNTIRMAALTGRLARRQSPWGMMVSTKDLAEHYTLRENFSRTAVGQVHYHPSASDKEE